MREGSAVKGPATPLSVVLSDVPRADLEEQREAGAYPVVGALADFDGRNLKLLRQTLPSRGGAWTQDRYAKVPNTALGWHTTAAGSAIGALAVAGTVGAMAVSISVGQAHMVGPEIVMGGTAAILGFTARSRHWLRLLGVAKHAEAADLAVRKAIRSRSQRRVALSYGIAERAEGTDVECHMPELNYTWRSHGLKKATARALRRNEESRLEDGQPLFFGNVWADRAKSLVADFSPTTRQAVAKVTQTLGEKSPATPRSGERAATWTESALMERSGVHSSRLRQSVENLGETSRFLKTLTLSDEHTALFRRTGAEVHIALDTFCALPLTSVGKPAASGKTPTEELLATLDLLNGALGEIASTYDDSAADRLSYLRRLSEERHYRSELD